MVLGSLGGANPPTECAFFYSDSPQLDIPSSARADQSMRLQSEISEHTHCEETPVVTFKAGSSRRPNRLKASSRDGRNQLPANRDDLSEQVPRSRSDSKVRVFSVVSFCLGTRELI
eukprot:8517111-Pyramimonas_sp.AAC.2